MRFKALNTFTDKLPLIKKVKDVKLIGTNTNNSLLSGVINGMKSEIIEMINKYKAIYKNITVYLTGGDLDLFKLIAEPRKNSIFAHDFITLVGLNTILEHNAK